MGSISDLPATWLDPLGRLKMQGWGLYFICIGEITHYLLIELSHLNNCGDSLDLKTVH